GLLPQDEAFVIGYTMGTAGNISEIESGLFKLITKKLYPHPYKFSNADVVAYNLGLQLGKLNPVGRIYEIPLEAMMEKNLGELRREVGIDIAALRGVYGAEKILVPDSKESLRLP